MGATAEQYLRQFLDTGRRPDLPETTAGTLRLDVRDDGSTDHWYLSIADQQVRVTRSADDAELVVRADRAVFDRMARGELHPGAGPVAQRADSAGQHATADAAAADLLRAGRRPSPARAGPGRAGWPGRDDRSG